MPGTHIGERSDAVLRTALAERSDAVLRTATAGHNGTSETPSPLHRALVVELVLAVLDDGRHRLQRQLALVVLDHVLQVEIVDRDLVVTKLEGAANRLEICLAHR